MNRFQRMMTLALCAAASCTGALRAQDAPEPATPPMREEMATEARRAAQAARGEADRIRTEVRGRVNEMKVAKEKAAFLGLSTSQVSGALREQMKLQRGFGLVVDSVEPESPADTAGIKQFDILQRLNDQLLVNPQQFGTLIRSMKPGDQVSVTLLRQGESQTVTATLAEKEMPVLSELGSGNMFQFDNLVAPRAMAFGDATFSPKGVVELYRSSNDHSSVYQDSDMTLTITQSGDGKTLLAKSKDGQTMFEGPIGTDAQREKLPKEVADKLTKFESRLGSLKDSDARVKIIEP